VVYLDSASTTQKPAAVVDAVAEYLEGPAANPGRGGYPWSTQVSEVLSNARTRVARFIGAEPGEVVFTAGATAGLNIVATAWAAAVLNDGDEVLYSPTDHAANVYPWLLLRRDLARRGRRIRLVPYRVTATGEVDTADVLAKVGPRTRLITFSHVHHVFGAMSTLREIREEIGSAVRVCVDASQSIGHVNVDADRLGADFLAFSAHKMFGLPGTGVLYCRRDVHHDLEPFLPGGGDGLRLDGEEPVIEALPQGLECGSPNVPGVVALAAAVELLQTLGMDRIAEHSRVLTRLLVDRLRAIPGVSLLPGVAWCPGSVGYGIVSFALEGVPAVDLGFALAAGGFYTRAGRHCLPVLDARSKARGVDDSVRVSVHLHTDEEEVDRFTCYLADLAKGAMR
jgi:cysteine desulfurase/selenocysteine lyase